MALFTPETARIAARNSHKPTSARFLRPIGPVVEPVPADNESQEADEFRRKRLARVRKQLDKLDRMIESEDDAQKLDRLASAQGRLSEQERQYSNRSMPPVLRAAQPSRKRLVEPTSEPRPACAGDTPSQGQTDTPNT